MHTLFNISTTILLIPFGNYLAKLATKILPEKEEEKEHHKHLKYIKSVDTRVDATFGTSAINLQNLRNEIQRMLEMARVNVEESFDAFLAGSSRFLGDVDKREDYIDYLNKEPGIYSARYAGTNTSYDIKNSLLLSRMKGVPDKQRTARFVCAVAAVFPNGDKEVVRGTMEGCIGYEIAGANGFGYDPIFFLPEYGCTSAELAPEKKNELSHRGEALRMMRQIMEKKL